MASPAVDRAVKEQLQELYVTLNPAALQREIAAAQEALWQLAGVRNTHEATTLPE